jgi:hypothetical protein
MARGYKTGGRKPGSKNKRTLELEAKTAELIEQISDPFEGDAHAFLVCLYKDPSRDMQLRLEAAKAAIRFEKPSLAAVEHSGEVTKTYVARLPQHPRDIDEWRKNVETTLQ